ncbi:hypothetical protein ACFJ8K_001293 [Escherichia coli]
MSEWKYTEDWNEKQMLSGDYAGFVYIFQFADGSMYLGAKQLYQRVKDAKNIKPTSKENGWREYLSSSSIVKSKIESGEEYTKTVLWCFATMREVMIVEAILILHQMLKPQCLNLAMMSKIRSPNAKDKKRLLGIVQTLLEYLR